MVKTAGRRPGISKASSVNATYSCIAEADTIRYAAVVSANRKNGMKVLVDGDGRLIQWQYYGDFKETGN